MKGFGNIGNKFSQMNNNPGMRFGSNIIKIQDQMEICLILKLMDSLLIHIIPVLEVNWIGNGMGNMGGNGMNMGG